MSGFLRIEIDRGGYIYARSGASRPMVHRETRNLHTTCIVSPTLPEAKELLIGEFMGVLELTEEGGGKALWVRADEEAEMRKRLTIWRSCYGAWPVQVMS